MKLNTFLSCAAIAAFVGMHPAAYADDAHHPEDKPAKAKKAEAKKPVKPHSHAEEKSGMPMPAHDKQEMMNKDGHEQMMKHEHGKDRH